MLRVWEARPAVVVLSVLLQPAWLPSLGGGEGLSCFPRVLIWKWK
nr:MAG TPA: hypothetical protein [Caudoviricetes sp.]